MKTRNLTQISLRNDPINRRMHGFSFRVFEDEIEVQDVISPLSFNQIPISSMVSWMKSDWHLNGIWTVQISQKFKGEFFRREELHLKRWFLGVTVRWRDHSRSTVVMRRPSIKTVRLYSIRLINDRRSRWVHVSSFETSRRIDHPLDFDLTLLICRKVHQSRAISAVITPLMEGWD